MASHVQISTFERCFLDPDFMSPGLKISQYLLYMQTSLKFISNQLCKLMAVNFRDQLPCIDHHRFVMPVHILRLSELTLITGSAMDNPSIPAMALSDCH